MGRDRQRDEAIEALRRVAELMGGAPTVEQAGRILDEAVAWGLRMDELTVPPTVASIGHVAVAEAVAAGLKDRKADD
ncbi:hypothetical protein [uncultured Piscinibacter sp.]|uniref:hypothetical protein n=1 Tax=uncultured Piscinibacter sp. TaxID=1131835 RepID=UPI0026192CE7|nr:hypothetical protein [uncultured Piscinibacter sp.]